MEPNKADFDHHRLGIARSGGRCWVRFSIDSTTSGSKSRHPTATRESNSSKRVEQSLNCGQQQVAVLVLVVNQAKLS
ncbi:hypothetical protein ACSBR2_038826 [Camellia fascicularis]